MLICKDDKEDMWINTNILVETTKPEQDDPTMDDANTLPN